jgi:DNA polymerase-3 subunit epsilon
VRLLGIDIETTGLDFETDYITEIGWVLVDTSHAKPLLVESHMVWDKAFYEWDEMPEIIVELTGITKAMLAEFGQPFLEVMQRLQSTIKLYNVEYIVAHNGLGFDKPFIQAMLKRHGKDPSMQTPWLDTKEDVPYPKKMRQRNLTNLAAEHGFLNPFPHAAVFDVMAMLKVLGHYDIEEVLEYRNAPWVIVRAMVDYNRREEAKSRGYGWQEAGGKKFDKCWVKRIKEAELEKEQSEAPFKVVVIKE